MGNVGEPPTAFMGCRMRNLSLGELSFATPGLVHTCTAFGRKILMMLDEQHSEELRALRNLERAVRAFSVTAHMLPVSRRQEILASALREVVEARKSAIRRARCVPFR